MAGSLESSQFTGNFAGLNGVKSITATRPDIIRSLLTVGYPSRRSAVRVVGRWRERMLVAMATGYLDFDLRTTTYFRNLEQSEKVGVSFLLGEAFTHWYAQRKMLIEYLVHVGGLPSTTWTPASSTLAPKTGAVTPSPKSRPDFIGIRQAERHVFESKGRIRKPSSTAIGKALGQVSALQSINGTAPATRCASFFMLKATGAEGKVVDPPGRSEGTEVRFDEWDAIRKAYAFFVDNDNVGIPDDSGAGYLGREIEPGVFFGIDKRVLEMIVRRPRSPKERQGRVTEIFTILAENNDTYEGRRTPYTSPGRDGTILIDNREQRAVPA